MEGFTRKNDDGREADFRLANRRLQPLGHLTARLQVYVTHALTRKGAFISGRRRIAINPSPWPLSATTRVGCIVRALLAWAQSLGHIPGHSRRVGRPCGERR